MSRRSRAEKAKRYQRAYAVLLAQISQLVALARQDANIGAMLLYGSLARLNPRLTSDVDLLILCQEPQAFIQADEASGQGMYMMVEATSSAEEWPLSPLVTDFNASDLPDALLANIAQDSVLLYQREGTTLPRALAEPRLYKYWAAQVEELIARQSKRDEARLSNGAINNARWEALLHDRRSDAAIEALIAQAEQEEPLPFPTPRGE